MPQLRINDRRLERAFRAIFDSAVDGMFILNEELNFIEVNPAGLRMLGRSREELLCLGFPDLVRDDSFVEQMWQELKENGKATTELHLAQTCGEKLFIEVTLNTNVAPGLYLAVMRDMTRRRDLEQQLLQSQKMEAIGRLAGGVAHDINNMLTVIRGYSELMLRKLPANDPLTRHASGILSAVDRSSLITQQLLAFSRRQVIQPRRLNLNQIIIEMAKLLQKLIGEDIQLTASLDSGLGEIVADSGQLGQILLNLVVNSRDALPKGGCLSIVTQNVVLAKERLDARVQVPPGEYVMISVRDNGCGMSSEVRSHIFEPFFTTKELGKGTGLGLATVYGIVRQNRGWIEVHSEVNEGTTFNIYFPRADLPKCAAPQRAPRKGNIRRARGEARLVAPTTEARGLQAS